MGSTDWQSANVEVYASGWSLSCVLPIDKGTTLVAASPCLGFCQVPMHVWDPVTKPVTEDVTEDVEIQVRDPVTQEKVGSI